MWLKQSGESFYEGISCWLGGTLWVIRPGGANLGQQCLRIRWTAGCVHLVKNSCCCNYSMMTQFADGIRLQGTVLIHPNDFQGLSLDVKLNIHPGQAGILHDTPDLGFGEMALPLVSSFFFFFAFAVLQDVVFPKYRSGRDGLLFLDRIIALHLLGSKVTFQASAHFWMFSRS